MLNFEAARTNMVESQVRPNGITDTRILEAMISIAREDFVPADRRSVAYMDGDILISGEVHKGAPRYLMEPMVFARLVQLAEIGEDEKALHVGCGSGYGTAVLARLAKSVTAIDEDAAFATLAASTLRQQAVGNATVETHPHAAGDAKRGPYNVILIEGRVPVVPSALLDQLKEGGRLVAVVGSDELARAMLYRRNGSIGSFAAFDASAQQLPGIVAPPAGFVF
jgi:protein-L-isoaspartate(D-aspartate) O-methyltransferase